MRRARGVSQEELGLQLELHRTYIGAVERGERNLTLQTIEGMAQLLEVSPVALFVEGESCVE